MHDDTMNPQNWIPDPNAMPTNPPPDDEDYGDVDEALGDDELGDEPQGVEGETAENVATGPSVLSRIGALAGTAGAACWHLVRRAGIQVAKLPAALRKKKTDDPFADPLAEDDPLHASREVDPGSAENGGADLDPDTDLGIGADADAVSGGFLASRRSRIQAAAFVSTGLLTTALVVHNVMKPGKPASSPDTKAATKKTTELAKAEPDPAPAPTPEPEPEPEPLVVSETVAPPPETIVAMPPPETIDEAPEPMAAPPDPVAATPVDPLAPDLGAIAAAEPGPAMPPLPPTEMTATPVADDLDAPPPALTTEEPTAIVAAPADVPPPVPLAAEPPPEVTPEPPALAMVPPAEAAELPEPAPAEPPPNAMAAAPALAIPSLAPPPEATPGPESEPQPAPAPEPAPLVVDAPEPAPVAEPVEPPATPTAAPSMPDPSELTPLPNAGRRILTMGTPIGEAPRRDTIAVSTVSAASTPVAVAVPISAESFQVEHVVQRGENFWTISKLYYGSGRFYKALWKANARAVKAPDALVVGNTIVVPPPESLDRTLIDPPGGNLAGSGRSTVRDPATRRTVRGADGSMTLPIGRSTSLAEEIAALEPETPRPSHVVRDGETLRSIARDRLGNSRRETEIRQLNLDVISDAQPVVGQRLRLPDDATAIQRR